MSGNGCQNLQVLRVIDFQGAWVRLAPDTEAQAGLLGDRPETFRLEMLPLTVGQPSGVWFPKFQSEATGSPGKRTKEIKRTRVCENLYIEKVRKWLEKVGVKRFRSSKFRTDHFEFTTSCVAVHHQVEERWEGWMLAETVEENFRVKVQVTATGSMDGFFDVSWSNASNDRWSGNPHLGVADTRVCWLIWFVFLLFSCCCLVCSARFRWIVELPSSQGSKLQETLLDEIDDPGEHEKAGSFWVWPCQ